MSSIDTSLYSSISAYNYNSYSSMNAAASALFGNSSDNTIYNLISQNYAKNNAKSATTYATSSEVKESGLSLSSVISILKTTGTKSLFNQLNATSSNESSATASLDISKTTDKNSLAPIKLGIHQVAKEQINGGLNLKTAGKAVNSGLHTFEVTVGDKKTNISVNVSASDNNESIQKKMVSAINDKKLGVTASISYDPSSKSSSISVASATTGNKNENGSPVFTISDRTGDLASKMGITEVSQEAQNAIYTVNDGEAMYSASNKIDLGNGVSTTLKSGGTSTTIDFSKTSSDAVNKVKELVSELNNALSVGASGSSRGSTRLMNDIYNMNKAYSSSLKDIGINVASNGVMSIDEDKLKLAAENGSLERMFQKNGSSGFANRVDRISSNMATSRYYADPVNTQSSANSSTAYDPYAVYSTLFDSFF